MYLMDTIAVYNFGTTKQTHIQEDKF